MAEARGRVLIQLAADTRRLRGDLKRVRTQLSGLQKFTKGISSSFLAMFGGFAVIQGFRNTLNILKDFEFQMSKVSAISGATAQDMQKLRLNAIDVGSASKFTAAEVGKLQEELSRLGKVTPEITMMTDSIAALAIVADTELGETAQSVAKTINAFQLTAKDTAEVTNIMAESFSKSALNLEKFQVSMANVGAIANVVGFSLAETTALLGILVDNGIEASKAGTDLRKIFSELNNRGITLNEALKQINESTNKGTKAFDLFGQRAFGAGVILANNTKKTRELTAELSDANMELDGMREIMESNLNTDLDKMKSAWQGLVLEGSALIPVLRDTVQGITDLLNLFSGRGDSLADDIKDIEDKINFLTEALIRFRADGATDIFLAAQIAVIGQWKKRLEELIGAQEKFKPLPDFFGLQETFAKGGKGLDETAPEVVPSGGEAINELKKRTKAMFESGFAIKNLGVSTKDALGSMVEGMDESVVKTDVLNTSMGQLVDTITEGQIAMQEFGEDISGAMEDAAMATLAFAISGESSMKRLGLAFLGAARQRIALAMAEAIGSSAKLGVFGIPLAIAAVAAFTALFDSAVRSFAEGGRNISSGLAVVGERGPELVQLPGGTNIIPNNKIGGIGGNITINFNGLVTDEHAVGQEITNILNKYKQNFG